MNLKKEVERLYRVELMGTARAILESQYDGMTMKERLAVGEMFRCELHPYPAMEAVFWAQEALDALGFRLFFSRGILAGMAKEPLPEDARGRPLADNAFLQQYETYRREQAARDAAMEQAQAAVAPAKAWAWLKKLLAVQRSAAARNGPRALYAGYWLGDDLRRQSDVQHPQGSACLARWGKALAWKRKERNELHEQLEKVYGLDLVEGARGIVETLYQQEAAQGRRPSGEDALLAGQAAVSRHPAALAAYRAQMELNTLGCGAFFTKGLFFAVGGCPVPEDAAGRPLAVEAALLRHRGCQDARAALEAAMAQARPVLQGPEWAQLTKDLIFLQDLAAYDWPRMLYLGFCFGDYFLQQCRPQYSPQTPRLTRWAKALDMRETL